MSLSYPMAYHQQHNLRTSRWEEGFLCICLSLECELVQKGRLHVHQYDKTMWRWWMDVKGRRSAHKQILKLPMIANYDFQIPNPCSPLKSYMVKELIFNFIWNRKSKWPKLTLIILADKSSTSKAQHPWFRPKWWNSTTISRAKFQLHLSTVCPAKLTFKFCALLQFIQNKFILNWILIA